MASTMKRKVDLLLSENATLVEKTNTLLRKGKTFVTLAKVDGSLTPAGKYYEHEAGSMLDPSGYDLQQPPGERDTLNE